MKINKIMCCCGCGLGSSLIVAMNVESALNKLGISGVEVLHTSLSDTTPDSADLFVIGRDLESQSGDFKNKILLNNIMDMEELESKLKEKFN